MFVCCFSQALWVALCMNTTYKYPHSASWLSCSVDYVVGNGQLRVVKEFSCSITYVTGENVARVKVDELRALN